MHETETWAPVARPRRRRLFRLVVGALLVVVALVAGTALYGIRSYRVASPTMEPTLHEGDHVLIDRAGFRLTGVHRGDLVVFDNPDPVLAGRHLRSLSRVIGLPGDRVSCEDGVLRLGGSPADEPYLRPGTRTNRCRPLTVPAGRVYLLMDNRGQGIDSRSYGPVALDAVVGRVLTTYRRG